MQRITFIVLFAILITYMFTNRAFSQDEICTTNEEFQATGLQCFERDTFYNYQPTITLGPIKVKFHVIRRADGAMPNQVGLNDSTLAIIALETRNTFIQDSVKIELEVIPDFHYIDDNTLYERMYGLSIKTNSISPLYDTSNAINV